MVLFSQVPKKCTDLNLNLFYILILGTYGKFARKNNFLLFGVCFLQLCSSAGRMFCRVKITCTKLPTICFASTTKKSMKCVVNWIPLRIRVRSRNTQPHLKAFSYGAILQLIFQGRYALPKGYVSSLRCSFGVNL